MTRKKVRDDCIKCHKELPLGCGVHRKYCNECQIVVRTDFQKARYQRNKRSMPKKSRICSLCASRFSGGSRICEKCVHKFLERRKKIHCLYCGKLIPLKKHLTLYCGKQCAVPSWYVLKQHGSG